MLVVHQAFAYIDKNVMECMQDNGVTEFARLLSGVDLTGDGKKFFSERMTPFAYPLIIIL